jgi:hypothetical protein
LSSPQLPVSGGRAWHGFRQNLELPGYAGAVQESG